MDPLQLLTRSSKRPAGDRSKRPTHGPAPSTGSSVNPQLYGKQGAERAETEREAASRKRKRTTRLSHDTEQDTAGLDFFNKISVPAEAVGGRRKDEVNDVEAAATTANVIPQGGPERPAMSEEERKSLLRRHKLKLTVIRGPDLSSTGDSTSRAKQKRSKSSKTGAPAGSQARQLYPEPVLDFRHLRSRYGIPKSLAQNVNDQGYTVPTEVQMASLPILLESHGASLSETTDASAETAPGLSSIDLLTVAPTGSGKTLAFMIPLIHALAGIRRKSQHDETVTDGPKAVILAPTKELANQIANEGRKLAANTGIRITSVRKGMHLEGQKQDTMVEGDTIEGDRQPPVKADVLVSTPLALVHVIEETKGEATGLEGVRYMVFDEADVLLDPLFRDQTLAIWNAATHPALRVSLWSATMGSNIEDLAKHEISKRADRLRTRTSQPIEQAPLVASWSASRTPPCPTSNTA